MIAALLRTHRPVATKRFVRVRRARSSRSRLWWELLAGPGPFPVRLIRWAQRNG